MDRVSCIIESRFHNQLWSLREMEWLFPGFGRTTKTKELFYLKYHMWQHIPKMSTSVWCPMCEMLHFDVQSVNYKYEYAFWLESAILCGFGELNELPQRQNIHIFLHLEWVSLPLSAWNSTLPVCCTLGCKWVLNLSMCRATWPLGDVPYYCHRWRWLPEFPPLYWRANLFTQT